MDRARASKSVKHADGGPARERARAEYELAEYCSCGRGGSGDARWRRRWWLVLGVVVTGVVGGIRYACGPRAGRRATRACGGLVFSFFLPCDFDFDCGLRAPPDRASLTSARRCINAIQHARERVVSSGTACKEEEAAVRSRGKTDSARTRRGGQEALTQARTRTRARDDCSSRRSGARRT